MCSLSKWKKEGDFEELFDPDSSSSECRINTYTPISDDSKIEYIKLFGYRLGNVQLDIKIKPEFYSEFDDLLKEEGIGYLGILGRISNSVFSSGVHLNSGISINEDSLWKVLKATNRLSPTKDVAIDIADNLRLKIPVNAIGVSSLFDLCVDKISKDPNLVNQATTTKGVPQVLKSIFVEKTFDGEAQGLEV